MTIEPANQPGRNSDPHARWRFFRDVLVFQLKLILGNLQNFLLLPVSLVAALLDFVMPGKDHGERFYWVLSWGRKTDEMINIYGAIGGYHATGPDETADAKYTVDAVIAKLEGAIVREYEKGGTAASLKEAVDKAVDEMQSKTGAVGERTNDAFKQAAERLREKMEKPPG
jgi:hypothetical protein